MKKIKFLLSGIAVLVFSALQAQTADEIIAKAQGQSVPTS